MKILAFTDIHASAKCFKSIEKKAQKAELLVCAGDISIFEHGLQEVLIFLNSLGRPVIFIHGNHESEESVRLLCEGLENLYFIHKGVLLYEDVAFLGYGGGGFSYTDTRFEPMVKKMLKEVPQGKKVILLIHQPPFGTAMDMVYGDTHVGNKSFSAFLEKTEKIDLVLCGHIHEGFGKQDKLGNVVIINPGDMGMYINL
jgi:uncharacterized protein